MNARLAVILVVLLVVLGGGALLYQHQERSRRPDNVDTLGRSLLKDLKAADVTAIRIVEPKSTLTVQQKNDRWVIADLERITGCYIRVVTARSAALRRGFSRIYRDRAATTGDALEARHVETRKQLFGVSHGEMRDHRQRMLAHEHVARRAIEARTLAIRAGLAAEILRELLAHR